MSILFCASCGEPEFAHQDRRLKHEFKILGHPFAKRFSKDAMYRHLSKKLLDVHHPEAIKILEELQKEIQNWAPPIMKRWPPASSKAIRGEL